MQVDLPLMPWPWRMELSGQMLAAAGLRAGAGTDPGLADGLAQLNAMLRPGDGATLGVSFDVAQRQAVVPTLGDDESYRLQIAPGGVTVEAQRICGAQHALTTLAQLAAGSGHLPVGRIEDKPRYPWRGLMLDVARRFMSLAVLLEVIDAMAFYKLNVLHLHLSDDQGFRVQSAAYPRLASSASYSRSQLRELVGRAAERGIRVIPELDMPGHVTSWLAAYPDWGPRRPKASGDDRHIDRQQEPAAHAETPLPGAASKRFGPHPAVLNVADEAVYQVIDNLFGELAEIFPDPYVHIGGDEVLPGWWLKSDAVAAFMQRHELGDAVALQAHFNARVAALAAGHGKRLIGWDEVLNGGAPAGMVVQAWRGATARDRALAAGHACVESSGYYLDLFFPADVHHAWDPQAPVDELLGKEDALLEDPRFQHVAAGMQWTHHWRQPVAGSPAGASPGCPRAGNAAPAVLGGEACLWSELVDERVLPVRLWSRMPAIAERLWSLEPPAERLSERLEASCDRLAAAGLVAVKRMSRDLLMESGVAKAQLAVVELLEPVKWYGRLLGAQALNARMEGRDLPQARPYTTATPLDRPVDALLPESFAAQGFARLLEGDQAPLRRECARLLGICEAGGFLRELQGPIGKLADVLKAVLDVLDGRLQGAAAWGSVAVAAEPSGEYIVAIAPPVRAWFIDR